MKMIRAKLVYLFCIIGLSIQIYHLTCNYLKFKVRHEVTYDYADQVELPTIDIIIPMVVTINLAELFIRYPEQMTELCKMHMNERANVTIDNYFSECANEVKKIASMASQNLASFIKVKDINELTVDPRKQIDYIQIANAYVPAEQWKMKRYFNGWAIFLRISCTKQATLIANNINIVRSYEEKIAILGHSFGPYFGIRFTSQFDMPVSATSAYFMIIQKADKKLSAWVRYEKMVSSSLPNPYETKCRHYNKLKTLSDCKVKKSFHERFLMKDIVNEWGSQPEYFGFVGDPSKIEEIKSHCAESSIECEKTTYTTDGEINSEKVKHTSGQIFIKKPVTPTMYLIVHPESLLSQYLIFVGIIIGTWFGFSVFDRLIITSTWIGSKIITKIRKGRESTSSIKLFTIRNSYIFWNPSLRRTSD
uniref:Uncharacterized protein n=1 Tax=Tetranychus urticae TaxID=32264 RepID=T1K3X8_TETUR